jgi:hypothetical protein
MCKNMLEPDRPHMTYITRRMRFAWCITKATVTHSEYEILISFPRQQWLRERASLLRYMYTACLCCLKLRHNREFSQILEHIWLGRVLPSRI